MEIKILNERENPLLKRKEIRFRIRFGAGTPTFKDVRSEAISQLKLNEKLTIMNGLETAFGSRHANCYAKVYNDEQSLKIEPPFRIKKNFEGKKKKEAAEKPEVKNPVGHPKDEEEKPDAEKKAEKPKEEKPVEKSKTEEKKVEKPTAEKPAGHPKDEKQKPVEKPKPEQKKEEKKQESTEKKPEKPKEEVKEKK